MRIVSWNMQHGKPNGMSWEQCCEPATASFPGRLNLADSIRALAEPDPDVIALQEVDRGQGRSGGADQPRQIATLLSDYGYKWWHFAPAFTGWVAGVRVQPRTWLSPSAPGYGVMLVARQMPRRWKVAYLGRAPLRWIPSSAGMAGKLLGGYPRAGENRVLLAADFGDMCVAVTHLELDSPTARRQLRQAWNLTRSLRARAALVGDFNLDEDQVRELLAGDCSSVTSVATYPATSPRVDLDHVLSSWGSWQARSLPLPVSDHAALLAQLDSPSQPAPLVAR